MQLAPGANLGPWRLERRVAVGGMAEVWAATDPVRGQVALKLTQVGPPRDDAELNAFHDELRISRRLRHDNIVRVFEGEERDGYLVQVMELLDGMDLRRLLGRLKKTQGLMPPEHVAFIGRSMARALGYAHWKAGSRGQPLGIVHRDVSPHNVMLLRDGRVKVLDFGIAWATERATRTVTGVVKGKTSYMAPEQTTGNMPLTAATDIFATGVVLWECLTGERLFKASTEVETMRRVFECRVPPVVERRPDVPPPLAEIVHLMLEPRPKDRPDSMLLVERALQSFLVRTYEPEQVGAGAFAKWMATEVPHQRPKQTSVLAALNNS